MALKKFSIGLFGHKQVLMQGAGAWVLINITILFVVLDELLTLILIRPQRSKTLIERAHNLRRTWQTDRPGCFGREK